MNLVLPLLLSAACGWSATVRAQAPTEGPEAAEGPAEALGDPAEGGEPPGDEEPQIAPPPPREGPASEDAAVPPPPPSEASPSPSDPPNAPAPPPAPPPPDAELLDDDTYFEPDPVLRLEGWLRHNEMRARTGRIALAVISIITGVAAAGGAVWAFSQEDDELRASMGGLFMLLGVFEITLGVAMLHLTLPQEDRLTRWTEVRERGATAVDVAAFAGELRMEAETARFGRTVGAVTGFSMAAGGATALILSATVDSTDVGRVITIAYGGAFLAMGALLGVLSLVIKTPPERDWERYERGLTPKDPGSLSLRVSPFFASDAAGLAAEGTF